MPPRSRSFDAKGVRESVVIIFTKSGIAPICSSGTAGDALQYHEVMHAIAASYQMSKL